MTGLSLLESASASFREQRMHRFLRDFGITRDTRLLDVGGTLYNWTLAPVCPKITILNRVHCDAPHAAADWVLGDGCTLPFGDHSFDVVFSNSVIEHLGTLERQQAFAAEVARVGRRYFVANSEPLVSDRDSPVESLRALSPQALAGRHGQALDGVGRADRHCWRAKEFLYRTLSGGCTLARWRCSPGALSASDCRP